MTLLDPDYIATMVKCARYGAERRFACGCHVVRDYCRTCDEFYWYGHRWACEHGVLDEGKHYGHRKYLVPYVEVRGRYELPLLR